MIWKEKLVNLNKHTKRRVYAVKNLIRVVIAAEDPITPCKNFNIFKPLAESLESIDSFNI